MCVAMFLCYGAACSEPAGQQSRPSGVGGAAPPPAAREEPDRLGTGAAVLPVAVETAAPGEAPPTPPEPAPTLAEQVRALLGSDLERAAAARDALVEAGPAAVPALRAGLPDAHPDGAARSRLIATAARIAERHPEGAEVLEAACADAVNGDAAVALAMTGRPAALRAALVAPHFADTVVDLAHVSGAGPQLETLIENYAAAWSDVRSAVRRARRGAAPGFRRFLDEIRMRATTGRSTGGPRAPPIIGSGPGNSAPASLDTPPGLGPGTTMVGHAPRR